MKYRRDRSPDLIGGWGYDNVGDEAILAGYLDSLPRVGTVYTNSPARTRDAQIGNHSFISEHIAAVAPWRRLATSSHLLICGGGYLNGHWDREIDHKLSRIRRIARNRIPIFHGVEIRNLANSPHSRAAAELLSGAHVAVRDAPSAEQALALGAHDVSILPDAVSLLVPTVQRYAQPIRELEGKVLVNLLNITKRGDASEAEVDVTEWEDYCRSLISSLGDKAVGLAASEDDAQFISSLGPVPVVRPRSIVSLVSCIRSASALFSVRMHPALLSSMLGKPTVSVPYCGKVRPTLTRLGVDSMIGSFQSTSDAITALSDVPHDHRDAWSRSFDEHVAWLDAALASPLLMSRTRS